MTTKKQAAGNGLSAMLKRTSTPAPAPAPTPAADSTGSRSGSRANTRMIGAHLPEAMARQLAIIAAEEGKTKQELLAEALDLLFVSKGKARIGL